MIRITEYQKLVALLSPAGLSIAHGIVVCGLRTGRTGKMITFWYHTGKEMEAIVMDKGDADLPEVALLTGVEATQLKSMMNVIDHLLPMLKTQKGGLFLDAASQGEYVASLVEGYVKDSLFHRCVGMYLGGDLDRHPEYMIDLFTYGRNNLMIEVGRMLAPKQIELEQKAKEVYAYLNSIGENGKAEKLLHTVTRLKQ